jgi:amino acid transporter
MGRILSGRSRKLTVVSLAAATYFMVSGGPLGIEELVRDCGYKLALFLLVLVPMVWSLPVALMVGELSAAIPAEGGYYVWVRRAMGPFWGFQAAWLSLMASIFDMALYPTLFVLYLGRIWPLALQGSNRVLIAAGVVLVCVLWNLAGAKAVGSGSVVLGIFLLSPFLLIAFLALLRHGALSPSTGLNSVAHPDLLGGIMVAMWNYMGWDNASTVADEVKEPQRTYPLVMIIALAAIVLSYIVPIVAVQQTHLQPDYWSAGSWASIASLVVGPWLGIAVVLASMVSSFGSFNSLTMSYSRVPVAMAEDGYAPRLFTRRLPNGVPWASIVACGLGWTIALGLSFDRLLMLDILLYGASLVLEFIALILLRVREPGLPRPFTIPGGIVGAILAGVGPTLLLIFALIRNRNEQIGHISALTVALTMMVAGVLIYFIAARIRKPAAAAE